MALRDGRHRAHVQHLEQQRPRRLHVQQLGVRTHQLVQVLAGREIGDLNVHALQHGIVQLAHRPVHAVRDQGVVARRAQGQHDHGHRRQARRRQVAVRAAFELREDLLQRGMRVHAHATVGARAAAGSLAALRLLKRGDVLEAHRAGPHRRQRHGRSAGLGVERGGARMLQDGVDVFRRHLLEDGWLVERRERETDRMNLRAFWVGLLTLGFVRLEFLSRRCPDCGIPMLAPVGLRFGSLRPAPGSRNLPAAEGEKASTPHLRLAAPQGGVFALGRPSGKKNHRMTRLSAEDPGAIRSAAPMGPSIGMAQGSLGGLEP
ncbi:hypothetical protein D9M68_581140 [compost metagenome]